jgi:hypothetical protein
VRFWCAALVVSILVHTGLVVLLFSRKLSPTYPQPPHVQVFVKKAEELGLEETPKPQARRGGSRRKGRALSPGPQGSLQKLFTIPGNFGPLSTPSPEVVAGGSGNLQRYGVSARTRFKDGFSVASKVGTLDERVPLLRLFERIDLSLHYPQAFAQAGISGKVRVEFTLSPADPKGFTLHTIRAPSPYLRVIVMRALKTALEPPLTAEFRRLKAGPYEAFFTFTVGAPKLVSIPGEQGVSGPKTLVFQKELYRWKDMPLAWEAGPLKGFWFMPIVGGDPDEIYEWAKDKIKGRLAEDLLGPYRRDPEFKLGT